MNKINNVVIVGGGSSAWLTTAYLSNLLPEYNYTIVDKEIGTPVGVGEATLLNFKDFMNLCGFSINEWYDKIEATEKLGIVFPNWIEKEHDIFHPFKLDNNDYEKSLYHRSKDGGNVAYHVNCGLLTTFIQDKLKDKVNFIKSEVVLFDEKNLTLKNGDIISADLFIDCTGFKSILKKNRDRVDLTNRLICDTAVAHHISYENEETEKLPYVRCEAIDEGWVWTIPVQTRMGSGFIFNRNITDIEKAKQIFSNYWNGRVKPEDVSVIDWTPYYDKNIWDKNVVSIGLSAGFIEPLESTGLALMMEGAFRLAVCINKGYFTKYDIDLYNKKMQLLFENSVDFVNMHYIISKRKGEFWDKGRKLDKNSKIEYYNKCYDKNVHMLHDYDFFTHKNWKCWLNQI